MDEYSRFRFRKSILYIFIISSLFLYACGESTDNSNNSESEICGIAPVNASDGLVLAEASGCLACHSIDDQVVGPS